MKLPLFVSKGPPAWEELDKRSLEMRFFIFTLGVLSLVLVSPLCAQEVTEEIVVQGSMATNAEVFPVSPGVARIEMGPLYGVYLGAVPSSVTAHLSQADDAGKGVASVAKLRKTPAASALICWKQVRERWNNPPFCGVIDGSRTEATIDIGDRRSEIFALVPVALHPETREQLAWVAHPENTQTMLRCSNTTDMASVFAVDASGTITIATSSQMKAYEAQYCRR